MQSLLVDGAEILQESMPDLISPGNSGAHFLMWLESRNLVYSFVEVKEREEIPIRTGNSSVDAEKYLHVELYSCMVHS